MTIKRKRIIMVWYMCLAGKVLFLFIRLDLCVVCSEVDLNILHSKFKLPVKRYIIEICSLINNISEISLVNFRYSTLISIKLAKMLMSRSTATTFSPLSGRPSSTAPLGVVVSLLTDSASWMPHRDLADSMGLQNNFLCHGKVRVLVTLCTKKNPNGI